MNITLRDYQKEAIEAIRAQPPGRYLVQMATGLGKTVTFANIPRNGNRMLILSHREELVEQPRKYFDCSYGIERAGNHSNGEEVVSASVQTLVRRLERFAPDAFGLIVCDECFPAGTMVDGKPIEAIKVGDFVTAYNHEAGKTEQRCVTYAFKHPAPDKMVRINGKLICTPNHPIYEVKKRRYVNAREISSGDCLLLRMRETDTLGGLDEDKAGQLQEITKSLLLRGTQNSIQKENVIRNDGPNKSQVCICENENQQSDEQAGNSRENDRIASQNRSQAESARRKWNRVDEATSALDGEIVLDGACQRVCCENRSKEDSKLGALPEPLQNRHSNTVSYACNRGGWEQPLRVSETGTGREEREIFEVCRVESVEILERRSDGESDGLCSDGYVYNLEVDGLNNYFANGFLVHNCHHAAAGTYRKILNYFQPEKLIGVTATPMRGDKVRLDDIFQKIIFQRDLKWGIQNGYLTDILCKRVNIGYDLSAVHSRMGDYAPGELEQAMDGTADAIAQAYREHAKGPTIIFAVSVRHAEEIAAKIPGAAVVTGKTQNRGEIVQAFSEGKIPVIVNCMVFTEGTDIPCIETCIMARPTQSDSLYCQCVGRALRPYPGKDKALLIDCVGVTGKASLCTAPSLLGLDMDNVPVKARDNIEGDLFELPQKIIAASDCPESWIRNVEIVDLWAKEQNINTWGVNFFRHADGRMTVSVPGRLYEIPAPDALGKVHCKNGKIATLQQAIDWVFVDLRDNHMNEYKLWSADEVKKWGRAPATEKQIAQIKKFKVDMDFDNLKKGQAKMVLDRLFNGQKKRKGA